jgi:malonate transporter and related proteins
MQILLDIILPVFGIVAIGYGAARSGVFPESATKGLSTFVFNFAIPPLLFRTLAQRGFSDNVEWGFLGAY